MNSQWNDVNTVMPRQGSVVLACFPNHNGRPVMRMAYYDALPLSIDDEPWDECVEHEHGEIFCPLGFYEIEPYVGEYGSYRIDGVTHWMLMPNPPAAYTATKGGE